MSSLTRKIRSPERGDAFLNGFILDKVSLTRGHLNKNLEENKKLFAGVKRFMPVFIPERASEDVTHQKQEEEKVI